MAEDENARQAHEGGHPHRGTFIVSEGEVGDVDGAQSGMGGDPTGHGTHQVLAYTAMNVGPRAAARQECRARTFVVSGCFQIGA